MKNSVKSDTKILIVGSDKYVRTVLAVEMREQCYSLDFVEDVKTAKDILERQPQYDIVLLVMPYDRMPGLREAAVLNDYVPRSRVGILSDHCDLLILSGKYDGYSVIDRDLNIVAIRSAVEAMVQGRPVLVNADLRHSLLNQILKKMATAANFEVISIALREKYTDVMAEPIPTALSEKLAQLP